MSFKMLVTSAALVLSSALLSASAQAQTTWTMASGYPESNFVTQNLHMFINDVEEKSQGQLKIDLRSGDSLIKLDAIKRAVQSGQVPIGEIRFGVYGNEAAIYNLDGTPGLANNYDQAAKLRDALAPVYDAMFKKNGMRILTYVAWPGQGFFTRDPVTSVADLEGQRLRINAKQTQVMGEKLGMEALVLPFAEVPQALSTGMVHSLWTSAQTGSDIQIWDYLKNYTYAGAMHSMNAIVVSESAFRELSPELQTIVIEAGQRATVSGWELSQKANAEYVKVLTDHGVAVADAPQDVVDKIAEIGQEMVDEWLITATPEEMAAYESYRKSIE